MKIIADSSPLISFAILGQLDLLPLLFSELYVPEAVFNEVSKPGKPHSSALRSFTENKIRAVNNKVAVKVLNKDVDLGEAEVIALALEQGIQDVLIDDAKGRKLAHANGLHPLGTIGVLLQAKGAGHISEIKPSLDNLLLHEIRISHGLYDKALELAGEVK
jgi:predicted nucleic acid-binding protein